MTFRGIFLLFLGLACVPDDKNPGDTDGSTDGSTGAPTGEPADPCECPDGCGAQLCSQVTNLCAQSCEETPAELDAAALDCALAALRDRDVGTVRWIAGSFSGQFGDGGELKIRSDGTAVYTPESYADLCTSAGPVVLGTLRDPSFFENCRVTQDFGCLADALASTETTCSPEESNCD